MHAFHPAFQLAGKRVAVDLPHLAFVTAIGAWSVWFCRDAWLSQPDVENLILIVPATVAAVALFVGIAAGCFTASPRAAESLETERLPLEKGLGAKIAGTMALLSVFVFAGPLIGFDVASFAYILLMMLFLGERRVFVLILFPLIFCVAAVYCFNEILATPLPLLLFPGDGS